jgi:Sulfotransferase family
MSGAEAVANKRIVFLVGAPRSGTTWLQLLLSRSPRIATANETHLFTGYTRSLFATWDLHRRNQRPVGLHHLLSEDEYFDLIRNFAAQIMLRLADRNPVADILLEKTPDHILHWRDIIKIFPNASFVHLVRDPRSVVASLRAAATGWAGAWSSREVFVNCETWIKYIEQSKCLKAATNNFLQVNYQDLWHDGASTLGSIFSWLGAPLSATQCSTILDECRIDKLRGNRLAAAPWDLSAEPQGFYRKGGTESWRTELTRREAYLIEHLTRDLMNELGFVASSRRKIIFPLIVASRFRYAVAWRRRSRQAKREALNRC